MRRTDAGARCASTDATIMKDDSITPLGVVTFQSAHIIGSLDKKRFGKRRELGNLRYPD
jgi:hypothetical protein